MMRDFTLTTYNNLLHSLLDAGYEFQPFCEFLEGPKERTVILRHDVDAMPRHSLNMAQIEHGLGIRGTYYFRIVKQSNKPDIIRQIAGFGHEIGYHYEDLSLCKGDDDQAIADFEKHLTYFRQYGPVKTICMHGSPLSRYDNRKLWERYNYREYGIIGEPYFDLDFYRTLYLTDTGRRWDGEKVSIRDKPSQPSQPQQPSQPYIFHSTYQIIAAAKSPTLPGQLMLTLHPQRWTNNPILWARELVWQNMKNLVKRFINADSGERR